MYVTCEVTLNAASEFQLLWLEPSYFDILLVLEGIGLVKQPFWQPPKQLRWEHFEI